MGIKIPISHSSIFGKSSKTPAELLSEVPSEFFIIVAPSLISISDSRSNLGTDIQIVDKYICNKGLKNAINNELRRTDIPTCLLCGYAVYNLMELYYEVDFNDDLSIGDNQEEIEEKFWAALFLLNEEFVSRSDAEATIIEKVDVATFTRVLFHTLTSINLYDITEYDDKEVITAQLVKSIQFFQFLENDRKYRPYLEAFYKTENVESWEEYLESKLLLVIASLGNYDKVFHQVTVPKDENYDSNIRFLDSIAYDKTIAGQATPDFVGIRSKPIIKVDDNSYRVISKLFLMESLYKSMKFYFTQKIHKIVKPERRLSGLYSFFTGDFAENIVLYSCLRNTFPRNWLTVSGAEFLEKGYDSGEPDFYARKSKNAILFESKDVILTGTIKQSMDHSLITQALRDKFNKKKKNGGGVGILQLIENCKRLSQKYYRDVDHRYRGDKLIIYPVIVVHDRMFDTPGINRFLVDEFFHELEALPDDFEKEGIKPLTLMNIDTLITYGEAIRDSGKDLTYFLDQYVKFYSISKKPNRRMSSENRLLQELTPFSMFLRNRLYSMRINKQPAVIMQHASFLLQKKMK